MAYTKIFFFSATLFAAAASASETSVPAAENRSSFIAVDNIPYAGTAYDGAPFWRMFSMCASSIKWWNWTYMVGDKLVNVNPHWMRDYVLTLKSMRYIDPEIKSFPDIILENQTSEGFFYEILAPITDIHGGDIVSERCRKLIPGTDFGLTRLEIEADIEYLMVECVWLIWQATGDDVWLRKNLPRVAKGVEYIMTNPKRWDASHGLAKRPYSIDTWDFIWRRSSQNDRSIHASDPMGIMHGDNSGLYQAQVLLSKMYAVAGDSAASQRWEREARGLRERINKFLWNGRFYAHYLMLDNVDYGADMFNQLSLSNSYDINRGVADAEQIRSVLRAYRNMRERHGGTLDDFRTLDPAFPDFRGMKPGTYVNGGIGFFIAGQLAVAAFENGMEDYGVDILNRCGAKISRDRKVSFLYNADGTDMSGGPQCWVGSELMNAMVRGLAGVVDNGALFKDVTISPRFAASPEGRARVFVKYAASGAFLDYEFIRDKSERKICVNVYSKHDRAVLRVLLPAGSSVASAKDSAGAALPSHVENVFGSSYLVIPDFKTPQNAEISYKTPVEVLPYATISYDTVFVYIVNNSTVPLKCKLNFSASGWKTAEQREFTLQPSGGRHREVLPLEKVETDGSPMRVLLNVDGQNYSYPITELRPLNTVKFKSGEGI